MPVSTAALPVRAQSIRGIRLHTGAGSARAAEQLRHRVLQTWGAADLLPCVHAALDAEAPGSPVRLWLDPSASAAWAPGLNTMGLAAALGLRTPEHDADVAREILAALLLSPTGVDLPSLQELDSAIRIRTNIVRAGRKTTLAFATDAAERPTDCWEYVQERGFVLRPGVPLIDALIKTTQPEVSGQLYSFSCYRATEYVILLGIAQELANCNVELFERLQNLWRQRPIQSGEFHDVFLREQGSMQQPLPPLYYVPGDRVWFRNPDAASADACGFEGSWVVYLGNGRFTNFWKPGRSYTLAEKCVEIYHWRHGLYRDAQGEARIDEQHIQPLIAATLADPQRLAQVMARMTRWREPRGVYTEAGGCMDTTREFARWVRPGTCDMAIPTH
jgi:hypothetical protein